MKVIGFNGSPRKDGNTTLLMGYLLREVEKEGIETELVQLFPCPFLSLPLVTSH
jgi:multimeric flavodoxin WrbA